MKRAYVAIREQPHYRHDAFCAGLAACGFHIERRLPSGAPGPADVLVLWNRYSDQELAADAWERAGGRVIVAENGYIGRDAEGRQLYAMALHGHNGSGTWPYGGPERFERLGVALAPWRADGEHVLVCPNRHFGMRGLAMPYGWEAETVKRLRVATKRAVRVRPHPNGVTPATPLAADLERAWAVVIWASSAGVHALAAGVPVVALSPWWILKMAAFDTLEDIDQIDDLSPATRSAFRLGAFRKLAWAQWSVEEIARGDAFAHLLRDAGQGEVAAAA